MFFIYFVQHLFQDIPSKMELLDSIIKPTVLHSSKVWQPSLLEDWAKTEEDTGYFALEVKEELAPPSSTMWIYQHRTWECPLWMAWTELKQLENFMEDNFVNHEQGIGIPILICIYCTLLYHEQCDMRLLQILSRLLLAFSVWYAFIAFFFIIFSDRRSNSFW